MAGGHILGVRFFILRGGVLALVALALPARAHGHGGADGLDVLPAGGLQTGATGTSAGVSLSGAPSLSSYPQAAVKLYLNFTGAPVQTWGSYSASAPAYDTDGDPTSFSTAELGQIQEVWARVAEKYSPFNVDVTTVAPPDLSIYKTAQMVIGGDGAWAGGKYGGFSYPGGFTGSVSNIGWVFSKNLGQGLPKYVAEASAHEAGHLFGLVHQSTYDSSGNKLEEYAQGSADKAPIMGFSYYSQRGLWWRGTSSDSPTSIQSDLETISGTDNGFGYRPDDHAGTMAGADLLDVVGGTTLRGAGVIEQMSDVDYFRFSSAGGEVDLRANVAALGPMLDLALTLRDAQGNVLAAADTVDLGESVSAVVPAGEYFLAVSSHGAYGDVGQYFIEGAMAAAVPEPSGTVIVGVVIVGLVGRRRRGDRDSAR